MADEDDATFYVGALRCKAQASWIIKIGVRQLPKAAQAIVKMRVGVEDREQAVRRFVHERKHTEAAALIDAAHGACPLSTMIHVFFSASASAKQRPDFSSPRRMTHSPLLPPRLRPGPSARELGRSARELTSGGPF